MAYSWWSWRRSPTPILSLLPVASALGIAVGDPHTALDLTVQALAGQRLLLVLDNCEHLLEAVDRAVAALRKGAPRMHVLATSQELLRHPDEQVYRLGALALPTEVTTTRAREAGAVQPLRRAGAGRGPTVSTER
jgi:predicted ATPase